MDVTCKRQNHASTYTDRKEQISLTYALLLPLEPPDLVLGYLPAAHAAVILAVAATVLSIAGSLAVVIAFVRRWRCRKRELCPTLLNGDDTKRHSCRLIHLTQMMFSRIRGKQARVLRPSRMVVLGRRAKVAVEQFSSVN